MNLKNLFFHIHYCNSRHVNDTRSMRSKITRTIQHHEFLLVTGGKGSITIEKKRHQVKEGMLFYIRPDVLHSIETDREERICFLSVHFSFANVSFNDGEWAVGDEGKRLPLHPAQELKDYYQLEDVFKKLVHSWEEKHPGYEFVAKAYLQQLIFEIFQNLNKQNRNHAISLKVETLIDYMHQNVNQRVSLAELAEIVHLSPFYLSRAFKHTTGYAVIEYFNKIKIDKAKELLIEGDKKVKEVAEALGFTDEFYFSRIFKKTEGISPSEFYSKNVHGV